MYTYSNEKKKETNKIKKAATTSRCKKAKRIANRQQIKKFKKYTHTHTYSHINSIVFQGQHSPFTHTRIKATKIPKPNF